MRWKTAIATTSVAVLAVTGGAWWTTAKAGQSTSGTFAVASVHDGDTFRIMRNIETTQPVRILGIDTPEVSPTKSPPDCMGEQAQTEARRLLENHQVTLQADPQQGDQDRYDRWLRFAGTTDVPDIGAALVAAGYARTTPQYPTERTEQYEQLQQKAKRHHKGGWAPEPAGCGWTTR